MVFYNILKALFLRLTNLIPQPHLLCVLHEPAEGSSVTPWFL